MQKLRWFIIKIKSCLLLCCSDSSWSVLQIHLLHYECIDDDHINVQRVEWHGMLFCLCSELHNSKYQPAKQDNKEGIVIAISFIWTLVEATSSASKANFKKWRQATKKSTSHHQNNHHNNHIFLCSTPHVKIHICLSFFLVRGNSFPFYLVSPANVRFLSEWQIYCAVTVPLGHFYPVFWFNVKKDAINAIFLREESEGGLHKDNVICNKLRIKTNNYWQLNCWCDKSSF